MEATQPSAGRCTPGGDTALQQQLQAEIVAGAEARRKLAESESLQRVSTALLQKVTLEDVLQVVCREACQLTAASGCGVLLLEGEHLRVRHWCGSPPASRECIEVAGSFAELAMQRSSPTVINDAVSHQRDCYREPRPPCLLAVPLQVEGQVLGVLDVVGQPPGFGDGHARLLSHLGSQAAMAIETARLRQRAKQLAVVEERQRLARELHDSVTQALYSSALFADAAHIALSAGKTRVAAAHIEELRSLSREAMLEMRLLIFELHPPALEKEGLVGALRTRLGMVENRAGLDTEVRVEGQEQLLSGAVEAAMYRLAQEALTNVVRHAGATRVQVRVEYCADALVLAVQDDGRGLPVRGRQRRGGMGLGGMRQRMAALGGSLTIDSAPGQGTLLCARIPLRPPGTTAAPGGAPQ